MNDLFKGIKKFSIATIIVSVVIGVLFIAFPSQCIDYISLVVGVSMIVVGALSVIAYIADRTGGLSFALGIIVLICGIVVCVKYRAILSIIVVIFGILILVSGLTNIATSIRSIIFSGVSGWFTMVLSVVTSIFGIVAITKSNQLTDSIVRFIGAALIIYSVLGVVSLIQIKHLTNRVKEQVDSVSDIEVEAVEEKDND
ncbi:MAG TPA: hypothetical protein DCZ02_04565, partial [Ruminococcaceae bacterium]|nr:hypothetical protein [Oscillospiraceae bacterium]